MKIILISITLLVVSLMSVALVQQFKPLAHPSGAAKFTIKLTHEDGSPVLGAKVGVSFNQTQNYWQAGHKFHSKKMETDHMGIVVAKGETTSGWINYGATKEGYYRSQGERLIFKRVGTRYEPWNPIKTMILKPILNPIPMVAKRVETAIPAFEVALPYDLNIGDWIAPRGIGKIADIIFTAKLNQRSEFDYDYALTVSFPNKGDGIQTFETPLNTGSEFRSPRYAPEEGYKSEWVQTRNRKPGQIEGGNYAMDGNRNYFIRVRTVLDEKGKVKSANYGKIYGEFMNFTYYLNPTPNDRNMEFDPKRNLLKGLKDGETVTKP
jgi:hypothetical protein